jgi:hypothetical protein
MDKKVPPQSWRRNEVTCYELKLFMLLENIQREEIDPKGLIKKIRQKTFWSNSRFSSRKSTPFMIDWFVHSAYLHSYTRPHVESRIL